MAILRKNGVVRGVLDEEFSIGDTVKYSPTGQTGVVKRKFIETLTGRTLVVIEYANRHNLAAYSYKLEMVEENYISDSSANGLLNWLEN